LIRLIFVGTLLLLALSFFLQNQEQEVTLRYFFGLRSASILIYKPILAAFGVGLLVSGVLLFPAWVRGRIELRRKTKALQEAEVDLERLRQALDKAARRVGTSSDIPAEGEPSGG
jgi:putative membrane protein